MESFITLELLNYQIFIVLYGNICYITIVFLKLEYRIEDSILPIPV